MVSLMVIVTVSVACSVSVLTKLNATSVNSLTSNELARNMCQLTSSSLRSPSWTGYMLVKVRHDLPEVGFVKVPRNDRGNARVFVDVAAELIVEFGQSQASVCLWWNVNSSNDDR